MHGGTLDTSQALLLLLLGSRLGAVLLAHDVQAQLLDEAPGLAEPAAIRLGLL